MSIEALKLALEHIEGNYTVSAEDATTAIKEALAQPEQEPVACIIDGDLYFHHEIDWQDLAYQGHGVEMLYTHPQPKRECPQAERAAWVGLTTEELQQVYNAMDWDTVNTWDYERAIEAKLKEKNT